MYSSEHIQADASFLEGLKNWEDPLQAKSLQDHFRKHLHFGDGWSCFEFHTSFHVLLWDDSIQPPTSPPHFKFPANIFILKKKCCQNLPNKSILSGSRSTRDTLCPCAILLWLGHVCTVPRLEQVDLSSTVISIYLMVFDGFSLFETLVFQLKSTGVFFWEGAFLWSWKGMLSQGVTELLNAPGILCWRTGVGISLTNYMTTSGPSKYWWSSQLWFYFVSWKTSSFVSFLGYTQRIF